MAPGVLAPTPSCPSLFSAYSSSASIKGSMSSNSTLSATAIPRSSSATPTGASSSSSSLLSPTYSPNSSAAPQSHAQGTTGLAMAYYTQRRLQRQGSNPTLRISPTLPDISESPTTPTANSNGLFPITETQRKGSPPKESQPEDRPVSFVSDWSESSNNSSGGRLQFKGDLLDLDGTESVFDGSVYEDGCGEEEDMWKAEKVLAGVKKRLNAFENSISKARESIITSPKTLINTPQSVHPRTILRPFPVIPTNPRPKNVNSHFRNASESAVPVQFDSITRRIEGPRSESVTEIYRPNGQGSAASSLSRQDSANKMRDLQDQMKDLRGRITSLQAKTRNDSLRRRSQNTVRGTPLSNIFQTSNPVYSNQEASSSTGSFFSTSEGDGGRDRDEAGSSEDGSRCGTPKPFPVLRKSMSYEELGYDTAFSTPGDEPTQIVSFPRRNRVRGTRSNSSSGSSDASNTTAQTALPLPLPIVNSLTTVTSLTRTESFNSISSYETAIEDEEFESPVDPLEHSPQQNIFSSPAKSMRLRTVLDDVPDEENEGDYHQNSPGNDDGYHSGPSTPQAEIEKIAEYPQKALTYEVEQKTVPLTRDALTDMQTGLNVAGASDAARSATNSIIGVENDELALKLPTKDRLLVENLCEELGKVCCRMELETDSAERDHIRKKLELALAVLRKDS